MPLTLKRVRWDYQVTVALRIIITQEGNTQFTVTLWQKVAHSWGKVPGIMSVHNSFEEAFAAAEALYGEQVKQLHLTQNQKLLGG